MVDKLPLTTLRIEVQGFRHAAVHMLGERNDEFMAMVKAELDAHLKPETIEEVMRDAARKAVRDAINEEVRKYLVYGKGRETIEKLAQAQLNDYFKNRD